MAKSIVICSDGTGNTAIKGRGTNVFKLFEAVDVNSHRTNPAIPAQLAFYDDGVGTEGVKLLKLVGGAAGVGLARNVRQLYRELSRVYDQNDRIFLFGFSRGAFTVRTLAGMIGTCGLLKGEAIDSAQELRKAVRNAYGAYRAGYNSVFTKLVGHVLGWPDRPAAIRAFRSRWPVHDDVNIAFVGVWDTVDAVGMPFALTRFVNRIIIQFKFPTQTLGPHIERACHALSLEDERVSFAPVLWTLPPEGDSRIEQVWFSGVHSNVGGGYPKQGMSLVALDWMLSHAAEAGLRLQEFDREMFRGHASVDDKLYDSRAGWGVFYRWTPRDIRAYCRQTNVTPRIHLTVAERIAHGTDDYAPGNLPPGVAVAITRTGDPQKDDALSRRAEAVQGVIQHALTDQGYLLDHSRSAIRLGVVSYWLFVASWLLLVAAGVGIPFQPEPTPMSAALILSSVWTLVNNIVTFRLGALWETARALWMSPFRTMFLIALVGFVLAGYLARRADRTMSERFSRIWHTYQPHLRAALKQARHDARVARNRP